MSSPCGCLRSALQSVWISLCQCSLWYHKIQKTLLRTICLSPWVWRLSHDVIAERNNVNLFGLADWVSCENNRLGVFISILLRLVMYSYADSKLEGVKNWDMSQVAIYGARSYRARALWWSVLHCNTWLMCAHKQCRTTWDGEGIHSGCILT